MTVSIFSPSLKIMTVGMLRMPYSVATPGLSSVLSFTCKQTDGKAVQIDICLRSSDTDPPDEAHLLSLELSLWLSMLHTG